MSSCMSTTTRALLSCSCPRLPEIIEGAVRLAGLNSAIGVSPRRLYRLNKAGRALGVKAQDVSVAGQIGLTHGREDPRSFRGWSAGAGSAHRRRPTVGEFGRGCGVTRTR